MINSYTQVNSRSQLSPEEQNTVEKIRQYMERFNKGGHIIAYRHGAGRCGNDGGVFVQVFGFGGDRNGSLKLRNERNKFTSSGVSPNTLVHHIENGVSIIKQ